MKHPRRLGERELNLINLYAYWELELEPRTFYGKWDVASVYEKTDSLSLFVISCPLEITSYKNSRFLSV